jgi:hypothetical protein
MSNSVGEKIETLLTVDTGITLIYEQFVVEG